jgi:hypothetical protein
VARLLLALSLAALAASLGSPAGSAAPGRGPAHGGAREPSVLLWGSGVFFGRNAFGRWLRRHHRSYSAWESLHPAGRRILADAAAKPVRFRPDQLAPSRAAPRPVPAISPPAPGGGSALVLALLALGGLLTAVSTVPFGRLAPYSPRAALLHRRRVGISAAGIGLLVGIIVAKLAA